MSKTVRLTDDAYAEIAAALEEKAQGMEAAIHVLTVRDGPQSEAVLAERAELARLAEAAFEFYGWSTWRSNGARSLPAGTIFKPPGEKA